MNREKGMDDKESELKQLIMDGKEQKKAEDKILREELGIDKEGLKKLKKKLTKIEPRSERGAETLFRLVSKNQYTLNVMIDRKSNIMISINAIILSIIIGTVLSQLDRDPHLIYPAGMMMLTNLISIGYAVFATRPELEHGGRETNNLMFYGNFHDMEESQYTHEIVEMIYKGDELYRLIAKDTYHLGRAVNRKFGLLRKSFNVFLMGIIISVIGFIICHLFFA